MPLNYPNDSRFDGILGSMRWVLDLQERLEMNLHPLGKLQKQLDRLVRPYKLMELAGWPDNSLWAASQHLAKLPQPFTLPDSVAASVAGLSRLDALLPALPPALLQQAATLNGLTTTFFKDWSALAQLVQPARLPQIAALQLRFDHLLADLAVASDADDEPQVFEAVASASAEVLTVGTGVVAAQQVTAQQLTDLTAALDRLTALQQQQAAAQAQTNTLLRQISQNTTESNGKKRREILGLLLAIVGTLVSLLAYLEAKKQAASAPPAPVEQPAEEPLSSWVVQAALLPHVLGLMQQVSPPRTLARPTGVKSQPRRRGPVEVRLPPGSEVRLVYTRRRWACIIYPTDDSTAGQGWILKKYLTRRPDNGR